MYVLLLVKICNVHTSDCLQKKATAMNVRDYDSNNGYFAWRLHVISSNSRSDIDVNTFLGVAAHLKCMLIRWYHKNKIIEHCFWIWNLFYYFNISTFCRWYNDIVQAKIGISESFLLIKQLLIIFIFLLVMVKSTVPNNVVQSIDNVFKYTRTYYFMYKTWSGTHSSLPRVVTHQGRYNTRTLLDGNPRILVSRRQGMIVTFLFYCLLYKNISQSFGFADYNLNI